MFKLEEFGKDIWIMAGDNVKMYSIPFSTRMTIVRLQSGELWLHSPVSPTPERCAAVEKLGVIKYLVAPNKIHSLGIQPWKERYPNTMIWVSPQFNDHHPDTKVDAILSNDVNAPWSDEIQHCMIAGHSYLDEVVFLHKASRTLIITDWIQKHDRAMQNWFWYMVKGMAGILDKDGGVPLDIQWTIDNFAAAQRSIDVIIHWNFDKLIISHGLCVYENAKAEVRRAFSFLLHQQVHNATPTSSVLLGQANANNTEKDNKALSGSEKNVDTLQKTTNATNLKKTSPNFWANLLKAPAISKETISTKQASKHTEVDETPNRLRSKL
jgi:hypothetical protein